jgi:hypothetical protein
MISSNRVHYQDRHLVLSVQDLAIFYAHRGKGWTDADEVLALVNNLQGLSFIMPWGDLPKGILPHYYRGLWKPEGDDDLK